MSYAHYIADIIGWEYKPDIIDDRLEELNEHIKLFQPSEESIYINLPNGNICANLISIRNLVKLDNPIHKSRFYKVSDGTQLKPRDRAGNWIYVILNAEDINSDYILKSNLDSDFEKKVKKSSHLSHDDRKRRLEEADQTPTKINVVTNSYKRNPDVVAEALYLANGKCALCKQNAPFKKTDGSPYLEVHHWTPLSQGGKDIIENAVALCPNCHKEAHFGPDKEYIKRHRSKVV